MTDGTTMTDDEYKRADAASLQTLLFWVGLGAFVVSLFMLQPLLEGGGVEYAVKAAAVIAAVFNAGGALARLHAHQHESKYMGPVWDGFGKGLGMLGAVWALATAILAVLVFNVLTAAAAAHS